MWFILKNNNVVGVVVKNLAVVLKNLIGLVPLLTLVNRLSTDRTILNGHTLIYSTTTQLKMKKE